MIAMTLSFAFVLCADVDEPPKLDPLTNEQAARVRKLLQETKDDAASLKDRLASAQNQIMKLYAEFKLDESAVAKQHEEILDLQKRLLANHYRLHLELRKIVGEERFKVLSQRIERILSSPRE